MVVLLIYLLYEDPWEDYTNKEGNQCLTPTHEEMQEIQIQQSQMQFL